MRRSLIQLAVLATLPPPVPRPPTWRHTVAMMSWMEQPQVRRLKLVEEQAPRMEQSKVTVRFRGASNSQDVIPMIELLQPDPAGPFYSMETGKSYSPGPLTPMVWVTPTEWPQPVPDKEARQRINAGEILIPMHPKMLEQIDAAWTAPA